VDGEPPLASKLNRAILNAPKNSGLHDSVCWIEEEESKSGLSLQRRRR
jgi:hypothetical protein